MDSFDPDFDIYSSVVDGCIVKKPRGTVMKTYRFDLKEHLRKLGAAEIEPFDCTYGLCYELHLLVSRKQIASEQQRGLEQLMAKWPGYSGEPAYPVPHPTLGAITAFSVTFNLWDSDTYGDSRRDLCTWLSKQL